MKQASTCHWAPVSRTSPRLFHWLTVLPVGTAHCPWLHSINLYLWWVVCSVYQTPVEFKIMEIWLVAKVNNFEAEYC